MFPPTARRLSSSGGPQPPTRVGEDVADALMQADVLTTSRLGCQHSCTTSSLFVVKQGCGFALVLSLFLQHGGGPAAAAAARWPSSRSWSRDHSAASRGPSTRNSIYARHVTMATKTTRMSKFDSLAAAFGANFSQLKLLENKHLNEKQDFSK